MKPGPRRIILPGLKLGHVIEDEQVRVGAAGGRAAHALLERIGEMNRARFLPAIEKVFDEFDRPGEVIRIDRIDLDLGRFEQSRLADAEQRLADALRRELRRLMPPRQETEAGGEAPDGSPAARKVGAALIDAFLHYLLHGAWPYGSALDAATAPAALLARLIEEEPSALAAMLRRRGDSDLTVGRLVRQMPPALLERLLAVLEPEDAAWILGYMEETRARHEAEPLVEETPEAFERLLWTIVLRDALHRAGLRANRRAFVGKLIAGIAEAGTMSYAELLGQLERGFAAVPKEGRDAGSLLSIIEELIVQERGTAPAAPRPFRRLAAILEGRDRPRGRVVRGPTCAGAAAAERSLLNDLRAEGVQARWLLRRLIAEDAEALLARTEGLLTAEEMAGLLLPPGQAERLAASLRGARGHEEQAKLLVAATAAGREAPADDAQEAPTPLARLEHLLEREKVEGPTPWPEILAKAFAAAAADDAIGLRRSMRRFAIADPARFADRVGAAGAAAALPLLILPPAAEAMASFMRLAGCSAEEEARLIALAATLPVSASPERLIEEGLVLLAGLRRTRAAALREQMLAQARRAGGSGGREMARALQPAADTRRPEPDMKELRRARALDALRAVLHGHGDLPGAAADEAGGMARLRGSVGLGEAAGLSGMASLGSLSPAMLRDALGGSLLDRKSAAGALRRLGTTDLKRLIALLAPRQAEARADLRGRLAGAPDTRMLASIAAALLVTGRLDERLEEMLPGEAETRQGLTADLELVERALPEGGQALAKPAVRRAIARLLEGQPVALIRLIALSPYAMPALPAALADPAFLARAFDGLPVQERDLVLSLAELAAGPKGRAAIGTEKAAAALAAAAGWALGRREAGGMAARWLAEMLRAASLSEQARLRQLLAERWPDEPRNKAVRAMLRLDRGRPDGRPEHEAEESARLLSGDGGAAPHGEAPAGGRGAASAGGEKADARASPPTGAVPEGKDGRARAGSDGTRQAEAAPDRGRGAASAAGGKADARESPPADAVPKGKDGPAKAGLDGARQTAAASDREKGIASATGPDAHEKGSPPDGAIPGGKGGAASGTGQDERGKSAQGSGQPTANGRPHPAATESSAESARTAPAKGSPSWLLRLLAERPLGFRRMLRALLRSPRAAARLARTLPESLLVEILVAASPSEGRGLLTAGELLALAMEASGGRLPRAALWDAVLTAAGRGGGAAMLIDHLLGAGAPAGVRLPADAREAGALEAKLAALAAARGHAGLRVALEERAYTRAQGAKRQPPQKPRQKRQPAEEARKERKLWEGADEEAGLRIAIGNAGLVLAAPYLPAFFQRLGLLDPADPEGAAWLSQEAQGRAVHLLQYLADGHCDRPEPMLALNKLLCGLAFGQPIAAAIESNAEEIAICRSLLEAMLANWPMLSDSKVEALQETFLQREGCIVRIDTGWRVDVERKVLDVLMDSLPWSFSMILHPWMKEPVTVNW